MTERINIKWETLSKKETSVVFEEGIVIEILSEDYLTKIF